MEDPPVRPDSVPVGPRSYLYTGSSFMQEKEKESMSKWADGWGVHAREMLHVLGSCSSVIVQEWKRNSCQDNSVFYKA